MILKPAAPLPPTLKTMKMLTVLYDSEANRPTPTHFQNHENGNIPMHLFLMILEAIRPLLGTSKTMKTISPMHFLWFWGQPLPVAPNLKNYSFHDEEDHVLHITMQNVPDEHKFDQNESFGMHF